VGKYNKIHYCQKANFEARYATNGVFLSISLTYLISTNYFKYDAIKRKN